MDFHRIIRSLSLRQITAITAKVILNPIMFYCFVIATKKCISRCNKHFGKAHHKNNKANAYRHALWNMLITHQCIKAGKNLNSSLSWAEEITNWHEKAFVNNPLETHMDLHNNKIGRKWYEKCYTADPMKIGEQWLDQFLMEKLKSAKKLIKEGSENNVFEENLVFIQEG